MMFRQPIAMSRALDSQVVKVMLPTGLRSNMLNRLSPEVRRRSFFIAGEASADTLQKVNDAILEVLAGKQTEEGARAKLRALPELLTNPRLQSEGRARLILETNIDLARGYGGYQQTQDVDVLDEFPAWEFYRAEARHEPRDWPARWEAAGGTFFPGVADYLEGRMIALKDDPIWEKISAFGLPYAPFDYNSGMDLKDVDRDEAERLGLMGRNDHVQPATMRFNDGFEARPSAKGPILEALEGYLTESGIGTAIDGVLKLGGAL